MMLPPKVRANLDRLHPVGGDWGFMYVTGESMQRECRKCGECCTLLMIRADKHELETFALNTKSDMGKTARFALEHWHKIDPNEAMARGVPENDALNCYSCDVLGEDNLCSDYKNRPPACSLYPTRAGQTVVKRCVYAGTDSPKKARKERDKAFDDIGVKVRELTP